MSDFDQYDLTDYNKPRTNLYELIRSRFQTNVNQSLFENTFNRFFSKTELSKVVGSIGNTTESDVPEVNEQTIQRQSHQLQPLAYKQAGAIDHILSFDDVVRNLEALGVDSSRLDKWASTEQFNFAPPIDFDKLINFNDYVWYDPSFETSPQYVTIRNPCNVASAKLQQKQDEIASQGKINIINIDFDNNQIITSGNVTEAIFNGVTIDIVNSTGNDGLWLVESSTYTQGSTEIKFDDTNQLQSSVADGEIRFDSILRSIKTEESIICDNSIGWDLIEWDSDTYYWDGAGNSTLIVDDVWSRNNHWVHRFDLPRSAAGKHKTAAMPIIEYLHTIEQNKWSRRKTIWQKKQSSGVWEHTAEVPSIDDIFSDPNTQTINPSFHENWVFERFGDTEPTYDQPLNQNQISLDTSNLDSNRKLQKQANDQTFVFPQAVTDMALAGQNSLRVYVDGIRQYGSYYELTNTQTVNGYDGLFISGIHFFEPIDGGTFVQVYLKPDSAQEQELHNVPVRTSISDPNAIELYNLNQHFRTEQVDYKNNTYPQFNMFNVFGEFIGTSALFKFKESQDAPIASFIGRRIVTESGSLRTPVFEQTLMDDQKHLYCYRDSSTIDQDNPEGLQTIWRTSHPDSHQYVPSIVDEDGNTDVNGDWEVIDQMYFNPNHEVRHQITFTEMVSHGLSIVSNQELPNNFFLYPTLASRLKYIPDYGAGGTIKEHNDVFDMLISSMLVETSNPKLICNFAGQQYQQAHDRVRESLLEDAVEVLAYGDAPDLVQSFTDRVVADYERNDFINKVFGDSGSFNEQTQKGIRNWVATISMLDIQSAVQPVRLFDPKLGINGVRHHDGHLTTDRITQVNIKQTNKAIVRAQLNSNRLRGWTPTQAADGNVIYSSYQDIPHQKLRQYDFWLESNNLDMYRFNVVAIQGSSPLKNQNPANSYWLRDTDGQLFQLTNNQWIAVGQPGNHTPAWQKVDIDDIYKQVIYNIEQRLYHVSSSSSESWFETKSYITDNDDQAEYNRLLKHAFNQYTRERNISNPYETNYRPDDPFTWNYSDVDVASADVYFPYTKDPSLWSGGWTEIYQNVFGTPYPHLEPWRLQGYVDKPNDWDVVYGGSGRKWTLQMWNDIQNGVVAQSLPSPPINNIPTYTFVCVNITNDTTTDGYEPDDLLPPFWEPPTSNAEDVALANQVFIRNKSFILGTNVDREYNFGEAGPIEWEWQNSIARTYDELEIAFTLQPMRFLLHTWGYNLKYIGDLNIDLNKQQVPSHTTTIFHGDVVDNEVVVSNGIDQWYINYNRYHDHDNVISNFSTLWKNWTPQMSYQFDSFIDPKSLQILNENVSIGQQDYQLRTKHSRNVEQKKLSAFRVKVSEFGDFKIRNNVRIPHTNGVDWKFVVDVPSNIVDVGFKRYNVRNYYISNINTTTNQFETMEPIPWSTGDPVDLRTSDEFPGDFNRNTKYYFIKDGNKKFRLASTRADAEQGIEQPLFSHRGTLNICQTNQQFEAIGGRRTPYQWDHNYIDTGQSEDINFPVTITGVQKVIDFFDGLSSYLQDHDLIPNKDSSIIDQETGRIMGWQTEIERLIDQVYEGLSDVDLPGRYKGAAYKYTVDPVTDILTLENPIAFDIAEEVFFYSSRGLPGGLSMNQPYYLIPVDVANGRYKVATTEQNAKDGNSVDITTNGVSTQYIARLQDVNIDVNQWFEINPYRYNIWINTPRGKIADVVRGPYPQIRSLPTIYDQNHNRFLHDDLSVYRFDTGTNIIFNQNRPNNQSTESSQYDNLHFHHGIFYVDTFEHVVMLNNYLSDGNLIYDPFVGVYINYYDIMFNEQANSTGRKTIGGFFNDSEENVIQNLEGSVEQLMTAFDQFGEGGFENFAHALLGYENPDFLDELNVPEKTKFLFWKAMLQAKGSNFAVDAFINSKQFIEAKVDEFWAYKTAVSGDIGEEHYPEIKVDTDDINVNDIWIDFGNRTKDTGIPLLGEFNANQVIYIADEGDLLGLGPINDEEWGEKVELRLVAPIWITSSNWQPINGTFKGWLNGNGYEIKGLTIDKDQTAGLFKRISSGIVSKIGFRDVSLQSYNQDYQGTIAGEIDATVIHDCYVIGSLDMVNGKIGGFAGKVSTSVVYRCWSSINAFSSDPGGSVGKFIGYGENVSPSLEESQNYFNNETTGAIGSGPSNLAKGVPKSFLTTLVGKNDYAKNGWIPGQANDFIQLRSDIDAWVRDYQENVNMIIEPVKTGVVKVTEYYENYLIGSPVVSDLELSEVTLTPIKVTHDQSDQHEDMTITSIEASDVGLLQNVTLTHDQSDQYEDTTITSIEASEISLENQQ